MSSGEDMVIPDEVLREAAQRLWDADSVGPDADWEDLASTFRAALMTQVEAASQPIARWARDEALKEAETAVRPSYRFESVTGGTDDPIQRANWSLHHAADRIRLLRGDS